MTAALKDDAPYTDGNFCRSSSYRFRSLERASVAHLRSA